MNATINTVNETAKTDAPATRRGRPRKAGGRDTAPLTYYDANAEAERARAGYRARLGRLLGVTEGRGNPATRDARRIRALEGVLGDAAALLGATETIAGRDDALALVRAALEGLT